MERRSTARLGDLQGATATLVVNSFYLTCLPEFLKHRKKFCIGHMEEPNPPSPST